MPKLMVFAFSSPDQAPNLVDRLTQLHSKGSISVIDAVTVVRLADGSPRLEAIIRG